MYIIVFSCNSTQKNNKSLKKCKTFDWVYTHLNVRPLGLSAFPHSRVGPHSYLFQNPKDREKSAVIGNEYSTHQPSGFLERKMNATGTLVLFARCFGLNKRLTSR